MLNKNENQKGIFSGRRFLLLGVFVFFASCLFFTIPNTAHAESWWTTGWNLNNILSNSWETVKDPIGHPLKMAAEPIGNLFYTAFKFLLYYVFVFVSWLLGVAGVLFGWVIDPKNVYVVLHNNAAIYESWKFVRDFFNLAFILVLLYSAFCTIFQIEKYHIKKIILMVILMALLVNFSFPVSRFIIDTSNVLFYYFMNGMFPNPQGDGVFAQIAAYSSIVDIIAPKSVESSTTTVPYLLSIIVFTFILMLTLLVIAVMFVIRLVVLAILIIFSPIGFVAAIFPSTKHYADEWWSSLFKYSFFAPIMGFMIYVAIKMLEEMNKSNIGGTFLKVAGNNVGAQTIDPSFVASMAYFSIPIVILWLGLITAQKMSIAGAGAVTGAATKAAKWAGKLPWRGAKAGFRATGVPGGVKQGFDHFKKTGKLFGAKVPGYGGSDAREEKEGKLGGLLKHGKEGWSAGARNAQQKRVNEQAKENEDLNRSNSDLINRDLVSGDTVKAQAAAKTLIKRDAIDDTDILKKVLAGAGNEADIKRQAIDKLGKKFTHGINDEYELEDLFAEIDKGIAGTPDAKKIKDNLKSKIKDDKNIHLIIDHEVEFDSKTKQQSYADNLGSMDPKDIGKQRKLHERIDSSSSKHDPEFSDFINTLSTNDRPSFAKMAGAMNITDKDRYKKEDFLP